MFTGYVKVIEMWRMPEQGHVAVLLHALVDHKLEKICLNIKVKSHN